MKGPFQCQRYHWLFIFAPHTRVENKQDFFQNITEQITPFKLAAEQKLMVTSYTLTAFSVQKRLEPSPTLSSVVCLSDRYDLVSVLAGETFGALKYRVLYKLRRNLIIMTNYFERQEFVRLKSRLSYPYLSLFVNAQVRKCSSLRSFLFNGNYAITCTVS